MHLHFLLLPKTIYRKNLIMKTVQHLSAIAIITLILVLIYAIVQQTYRSNANDPQVQIAHELRARLQKGQSLGFDDTIELESSLSVFKGAYDKNGNPLQSTGVLNGQVPTLPKGVFKYARANGEHWITWQPQQNVRMATGIISVNAAPIAYLAVGRSLREVEERSSGIAKTIFMGWILCICIVLINWLITFYQNNRKYIAHVTK